MRIARIVATAFTALCLVVALVSLLRPARYTVCRGADCRTVSCGSPAFPKALIDFENMDEASNCAGGTSAAAGLYLVALATLGLVAVAVTSGRGRPPAERSAGIGSSA